MKNITESIKMVDADKGSEIFWDEPRCKVILFVGDEPKSYITLYDQNNDEANAAREARNLLKGSGIGL